MYCSKHTKIRFKEGNWENSDRLRKEGRQRRGGGKEGEGDEEVGEWRKNNKG